MSFLGYEAKARLKDSALIQAFSLIEWKIIRDQMESLEGLGMAQVDMLPKVFLILFLGLPSHRLQFPQGATPLYFVFSLAALLFLGEILSYLLSYENLSGVKLEGTSSTGYFGIKRRDL